jgi:hypothetical protein
MPLDDTNWTAPEPGIEADKTTELDYRLLCSYSGLGRFGVRSVRSAAASACLRSYIGST